MKLLLFSEQMDDCWSKMGFTGVFFCCAIAPRGTSYCMERHKMSSSPKPSLKWAWPVTHALVYAGWITGCNIAQIDTLYVYRMCARHHFGDAQSFDLKCKQFKQCISYFQSLVSHPFSPVKLLALDIWFHLSLEYYNDKHNLLRFISLSLKLPLQ